MLRIINAARKLRQVRCLSKDSKTQDIKLSKIDDLNLTSVDPLYDDEVIPGRFRQDFTAEISSENTEKLKNWRKKLIEMSAMVSNERKDGVIFRIELDSISDVLMYEESIKSSFDESFRIIEHFLVTPQSEESSENILKILGIKETDSRVIQVPEKTTSKWNLQVQKG